MNQAPHKYNPGFHDDEELVRAFVVRQRELELLLETVRENTGPANQHLLVVGPRGSGKTMLVRRAAVAVRADPALSAQWYPLVLPEEAYEVLSAGEFWLEALFHLGNQTEDERWHRAYEELKQESDETRLRERALAQLLDFADQQGKRILLVAENLNMLLGEQLRGQGDWDLRHTLQNEPRLMVLATATARFEEIERIDRAWFELFAIHDLRPLEVEDCRTLWAAVSGVEAPAIRLRPIQILTGGNPRLLRILAEFAAKRSFRELMENLIQLIDEHTDYFKSQLDNLAPAERKVFVVLLDLWDPATAQEVARSARMDVSKTSALLHRLVDRGAVTIAGAAGRRKWYQTAERLYNIYYLMRRRGQPSNRVRAIVAFMVQFYEGDELVEPTVRLALEACQLDLGQRLDHYQAYREILNRIPDSARFEILAATPDDFLKVPELPEAVRDLADLLPQDVEEWIQYGNALVETGKLPEAEQAYRRAIEVKPDFAWAWVFLGVLLHVRLRRFSDAEQAYRKAIQLDHNNGWAWEHLGALLHENPNRLDEAEQAYRKALELQPDNAWAWIDLGKLLHNNLNRLDEAEQAYRKALELKPDDAWAWSYLGALLIHERNRLDEAEQACRKAIALKSGVVLNLPSTLLLGLVLGKQKRWQESLELLPSTLDFPLTEEWVVQGQTSPAIQQMAQKLREETSQMITSFFTFAAAAGHAREALQILTGSKAAAQLEPLETGLRLFLGEQPRVAQEILEVGRDVAQRIRELQSKEEAQLNSTGG